MKRPIVVAGVEYPTVAAAARALGVDPDVARNRLRAERAIDDDRSRQCAHLDQSWDDDREAREFVELHPGGATQQEIADFFGVTRQAIEKIESEAIEKLRKRLSALGIRSMEQVAGSDEKEEGGWWI